MTQQPQQPEKRNASQRLDDMERALMALYNTADSMARDMMTLKEAIKLLGNKLDSVVQASNDGNPLSDDVIAKYMIENNVAELKKKVQDLVDQGILVTAEESTAESFVVGREQNDEGKTVNPRIQFVVSALTEDLKAKFVGVKVGQHLSLKDDKLKILVDEIYAVVAPSIQEAPEVVAEVAASAPEAEPAPEASASEIEASPEALPAEEPAAEAAPAVEVSQEA